MRPCSQGRAYLKSQPTLEAAWANCPDWGFYAWYLGRCDYDERVFAHRLSELYETLDSYAMTTEDRNRILCDFVKRVYPFAPDLDANSQKVARLSL